MWLYSLSVGIHIHTLSLSSADALFFCQSVKVGLCNGNERYRRVGAGSGADFGKAERILILYNTTD